MATLEPNVSAPDRPGDFASGGDRSLLLQAVVLGAMAGGLGWGIRGQYGHETGAMIAGVLIGFVMVMLFLPNATSLRGARAVALLAIGISFGGSMTYGQTLGLTHDPRFVGRWDVFRWGMLGVFLKGGIWFGFAGAFLGIGLGGKRWRPVEMLLLLLAMLGLLFIGVRVLNRPFDPSKRILPPFYFSFDWRWLPGAGPELKPRAEVWGGLLFALVGLIGYAGWVRRDRLAVSMAGVGFVAGGLGFGVGQCIQAYHAWNLTMFRSPSYQAIEAYTNWWNMMETTFGMIGGGGLGLGLWWNRRLITQDAPPDEVSIAPVGEIVMLAAHVFLLVGAEFHLRWGQPQLLESGLVMALLALPGILGGRYWPYLFALPIVAVPIAGKTLLALSYKESYVAPSLGWCLLVALPLGLTLVVALALARKGRAGQTAGRFASLGLGVATWLYFGLNFAFFHLPWPWAEWTRRTPNALIFSLCSLGLTVAAIAHRRPAILRPPGGPDSARAVSS